MPTVVHHQCSWLGASFGDSSMALDERKTHTMHGYRLTVNRHAGGRTPPLYNVGELSNFSGNSERSCSTPQGVDNISVRYALVTFVQRLHKKNNGTPTLCKLGVLATCAVHCREAKESSAVKLPSKLGNVVRFQNTMMGCQAHACL